MKTSEVFPSPVEKIVASFPFFGGTTTETPATGEKKETPTTTPTSTPTTTPTPTTDPGSNPIEELAKDPNKIGQLLAQVEALQKNLKDATTKVSEFETKQEAEARKQQTREQQLEADLQKREQAIAQMDGIIRKMAIGNAILTQKDYQWNSLKQVLGELNPEAFEIDVDLAHETATVSGIETEIKRIAKECPWLVAQGAPANGANPVNPVNPARPKGSGGPPAPPGSNPDKTQRRAELMKRFPVIAH